MQAPHLKIVPEEASSDERGPIDLDSAYRSYAPYVARIAMRVLGSKDGIDDIVQDVFLEAHRGIRKLREPAALKGWLATITIRRVRKKLRRRAVRRALGFETTGEQVELIDGGASPEQRALLTAVYRVLDGLPASVRIAWVMKHVEGERLERVAELTGCSRATAHRLVTRARAALLEAFDDVE